MCDYCGCRSDATIAGLSADHERLSVLASEVARSLDAENMTAARRTLVVLSHLLSAHTRREETGLFAELLAAGELAGAVDARCAEHDEIGTAVDAALLPSGIDRAAARGALDLLASHIWAEETDLFPAATLALPAIAFAGGTR
jgi:hemerythrin HHE cation binding domain-containing protein